MNYKAVIFDLDGTIVDSAYVWEKIDTDFFKKRNMPVPEDYSKKIGVLSFDEAAVFTKKEYGFAQSAEEIKKEWFETALFEYSNNIKLKDGVYNYIKYLKENNIKIGLATASPVELYSAVLKNNKIYDFFDVFTTGSEVKRNKSFGDIYLLSAKKLDTDINDCLVFEDILKAVKAAKSVGMTVYAVYDKSSEDDKDEIIKFADNYIYSFSELLIN